MAKQKKAVRRKKQAAASVGLSPAETREETGAADEMAPLVERDGGAVLGAKAVVAQLLLRASARPRLRT